LPSRHVGERLRPHPASSPSFRWQVQEGVAPRGGEDGLRYVPRLQENEYGLIKRLVVVEEWLEVAARRLGTSRLRILDYGCGTGDHITFPIAQAGHEALGVDVHGPSILEARRRYALPNLAFREWSIEELLGEDRTFDAVICSEVLEHLPDPASFLGKLRRLIRPGGVAVITTPNGYGSFEMLHRLQRGFCGVGLHQLIRWIFWKGRQGIRWGLGRPVPRHPLDMLPGQEDPGFLNFHSNHVQFFRLKRLEVLFHESGFRVVARRARTLLCGPYADVLFHLCPWRQTLYRLNNRLADLLPFAWAADWMFLLEPREDLTP